MTVNDTRGTLFEGAEIISEFSWNSRIANGELLNVSESALRAGVSVPAGFTSQLDAAIKQATAVPGGPKHDRDHAWGVRFVLFTLREAMKAHRNASEVTFNVVLNEDTVTCVATLGPKGPNDPAPAITVMLQEEYDD